MSDRASQKGTPGDDCLNATLCTKPTCARSKTLSTISNSSGASRRSGKCHHMLSKVRAWSSRRPALFCCPLEIGRATPVASFEQRPPFNIRSEDCQALRRPTTANSICTEVGSSICCPSNVISLSQPRIRRPLDHRYGLPSSGGGTSVCTIAPLRGQYPPVRASVIQVVPRVLGLTAVCVTAKSWQRVCARRRSSKFSISVRQAVRPLIPLGIFSSSSSSLPHRDGLNF